MKFFVMSLLSNLLHRFAFKVNNRMLDKAKKKQLDSDMASTLNQMAGLIDTIKNSLNDSGRYNESQLRSIREIDNVGMVLSSTLVSLIDVFKDKEYVSLTDAQLATETVTQCKEFINSLAAHVLMD